ncbi:hypothetical protein R3P38DRAFT_3104502 [Favolaschia claudopus]|uniref:Uncharacterized protein n=1 Tax=Favolaschia claudopus TaxID=2862362 RepID=A0AAV9ZJX0_9AGAR
MSWHSFWSAVPTPTATATATAGGLQSTPVSTCERVPGAVRALPNNPRSCSVLLAAPAAPRPARVFLMAATSTLPFSGGFRYRHIESLRLPSIKDQSTSTSTAGYSNKEPSISAPVFCQEDGTLASALLQQFRIMFARPCFVDHCELGDCFTPPECKKQWQNLAKYRELCSGVLASS